MVAGVIRVKGAIIYLVHSLSQMLKIHEFINLQNSPGDLGITIFVCTDEEVETQS